ncbi:uncharacterized protein LOC133343921 [Lethenteron reissneri]|uniref:uncharacterized protein LOC133343921 n=1 Tax=Lethenteron reissneri TaxID=7753 RepID=UPI002AB5FCDB|nr:uncharacterized protein LOC133343921 [Lethenteron reissneri]
MNFNFVTLNKKYSANLSDTNSSSYIALNGAYTSELTKILSQKYPNTFVGITNTFRNENGMVAVQSNASFYTVTSVVPSDVFELIKNDLDTSSTLKNTDIIVNSTSITIDGTRPYKPVAISFEVINKGFTDSLQNRTSKDYADLNALVSAEIRKVLLTKYNSSDLLFVSTSFTNENGRLKVNTDAIFKENSAIVASDVMTLLFQDTNVATLELGATGLVVDEQTYQVDGTKPYTTKEISFDITNKDFTSSLKDKTSKNYTDLNGVVSKEITRIIAQQYKNSNLQFVSVSFTNESGHVKVNANVISKDNVNIKDNDILMLLVKDINTSMLLGSTGLVVDERTVAVAGVHAIFQEMNVTMRIINFDYNDELLDVQSLYYKSLSRKIIDGLGKIVSGQYADTFRRVSIAKYSKGSVIAKSTVQFLMTAPTDMNLLTSVLNNVDSSSFLKDTNLQLDRQSIIVNGTQVPSSSSSAVCNPSFMRCQSVPPYGIAIIVMGILLLPLIAILAVLWKKGVLHCPRLGKSNIYKISSNKFDRLPSYQIPSYKPTSFYGA